MTTTIRITPIKDNGLQAWAIRLVDRGTVFHRGVSNFGGDLNRTVILGISGIIHFMANNAGGWREL